VVIGGRYSVLRRQGYGEEGTTEEKRIVEYESVLMRVVGGLAGVYVYHFAVAELLKMVKDTNEKMRVDPSSAFSLLPDIHAISCALKAHLTWWTTRVLEDVLLFLLFLVNLNFSPLLSRFA
jgi:hypothetical protein